MRLVAPLGVSAVLHIALVIVAARAPSPRHAHATVPLKMSNVEHRPKPPLPPPPPPRRIARATPKRAPTPLAPAPMPPAPPQGFSVDTKSTVERSSVAVAAAPGGGNPFGNANLPPSPKSTAPPPPPAPAPLEPAQWLTDEADRSPPYPGAALRNEIEGQVLLRVCIDPAGAVETVQVLKGLGFGCDEAAASWAKQRWRFRPARRGGTPVRTCLMQPMRFQLQR